MANTGALSAAAICIGPESFVTTNFAFLIISISSFSVVLPATDMALPAEFLTTIPAISISRER